MEMGLYSNQNTRGSHCPGLNRRATQFILCLVNITGCWAEQVGGRQGSMAETSGRRWLGVGRRRSLDQWDGEKQTNMWRFGSWRKRSTRSYWGLTQGWWGKEGMENETQDSGRRTWVHGVPFVETEKPGKVAAWRECGVSRDSCFEVHMSYSVSGLSLCLLRVLVPVNTPATWAPFAEGVGCGQGGRQESQLFAPTGLLLRCPGVIWCFTQDFKSDVCEMYCRARLHPVGELGAKEDGWRE